MLDELEEMPTEYHRLGHFIRRYLNALQPGERNDDVLFKEFARLELDSFYPDQIVELLQSYCELQCTTMPVELVERSEGLSSILKFTYSPNLISPTIEDILIEIGFKPVPKIRHGLNIAIKDMQSSLNQLGNAHDDSLESPPQILPLDTIQGAGINAFSKIEMLLEYVISFYGRWLIKEQVDLTNEEKKEHFDLVYGEEFISHLTELFNSNSRERRILRRWLNREEKLSIGQSIHLIKKLNDLIRNRETSIFDTFQSIFHATEVISEDELEAILNLNREYRHNYAHNREPDIENIGSYHEETRNIVEKLLNFANYLGDPIKIPDVVIVLRRITSGDGSVRLDCLHDSGESKIHRFNHFVQYYKLSECFFYQPDINNDEESNEEIPPVIMPVEFRQNFAESLI